MKPALGSNLLVTSTHGDRNEMIFVKGFGDTSDFSACAFTVYIVAFVLELHDAHAWSKLDA